MIAAPLEFGPRRLPIWMARICGGGACLFGAGMLALGIFTAGQDVFYLYFFGVLGLCAGTFGAWLLVNGVRMAKLRAVVMPDALYVRAHGGRHLWFQRGLAEATIPWAEIQGFTGTRTLNIAAKNKVQTTYILYTSRGDFTLNDVQWENLDGLLGEVSSRTGRAPGEVAAARTAARAEVQAGERRMFSWQRMFGWIVVAVSAPLALLVLIGGFIQGFPADVVRAFGFLVVALSLGSWMIRFYRK